MSCMCRKCGGESVMVELDHVVEEVLKVINDNGFSQKGAFNLRQNGTSICHGDSEHIKIKKKTLYTMISISQTARTLRSLRAAGSTTADAMRADMTGSIPFMLERMRTSVIRKSIMEMEMEPAAVC